MTRPSSTAIATAAAAIPATRQQPQRQDEKRKPHTYVFISAAGSLPAA